MKVYIVRHGQSVANLNGYRAGQTDSPLTDSGRADAARAGKKLKEVKFDLVLSSDLCRARETGSIALPGYEIKEMALIREVDVGGLVGLTEQQCREKYNGDEYARNVMDMKYDVFGGESEAQVMDRVERFMHLLESLDNLDNVAVFSHGGYIGMVIRYVLGFPIDKDSLRSENGAVTVIEWKNQKWSLKKFNS